MVRQGGGSLHGRVLEAVGIQHKTLAHKLAELAGGPNAELRAADAVHAVAHGSNHVQVVEFHLALDSPGALLANCQVFLDSSNLLELRALINIINVKADVLLAGLEEVRHHLLGHPDGVSLNADFHFHQAVRRGVEQQFGWLLLAHGQGFGMELPLTISGILCYAASIVKIGRWPSRTEKSIFLSCGQNIM